MKLHLLLMMVLLSTTMACDWLKNIEEKKVTMELQGNGLHRNLEITTKLSSSQRFSECRLIYQMTIPKGAYVDTDSLNSTLIDHSFYTKHRFNVEAPAGQSKLHKILILYHQPIRKSFTVQDKLNVAVHLRYHPATKDAVHAEVEFTTPLVALDCPTEYSQYDLKMCPGKRTYLDYGVPSTSPNWILVEPLDKVRVAAHLPVGEKNNLLVVLCGTAVTLILSISLIVTGK